MRGFVPATSTRYQRHLALHRRVLPHNNVKALKQTDVLGVCGGKAIQHLLHHVSWVIYQFFHNSILCRSSRVGVQNFEPLL